MLDINNISLKNQKTWDLIQKGHTSGVFQLESELGKQWASKIKPRNITELSAVLSLIRPACLESGMTDQYCRIKNNQEPPFKFNDEAIDKILGPTNGVLIFQEQLMKFGGEIAWVDMERLERLVMVDKLRKGIGKKDMKLLADLKKKFIDGCVRNGRTEDLANKLFTMIENAGRYAFNDAHAKKYAMISYQTAYLKANFPYEFYSVYLSYSRARQKAKEEIRNIVNEARMLGIKISAPKASLANKEFMISGEGKDTRVYFGLSHIKQVSTKDVSVMKDNPDSLSNFCDFILLHFDKERLPNRLRSLCVESLISSGACDEMYESRSVMLEIFNVLKGLTPRELKFVCVKVFESEEKNMSVIINAIIQCSQELCTKGRKDLVMSEAKSIDLKDRETDSWRCSRERDSLGVSFTKIFDEDKKDHDITCKDCFRFQKDNRGQSGKMAVSINEIIPLVTKKGKNPGSEMCQMIVSDNSGSFKIACFPDKYSKYKSILNEGEKYIINVQGTGFGWCLENAKVLK